MSLEAQVISMTVSGGLALSMSVNCDDGITMAVEESTAVGMTVTEPVSISVDVSEPVGITMDVGGCVSMGGLVEHYDGDYNVIPMADEIQTLETANKYLAADVTVQKIPYYETSNNTGETVYIASEVN